MLNKYKKLIIVIIILVIGFFLYSNFFVSDSADNSLLTATGPAEVQVLGQDIIRNLNKIAALKLDASVFNDPVLLNLSDFSEEITPQDSGRRNPFSSISGSTATPDGE